MASTEVTTTTNTTDFVEESTGILGHTPQNGPSSTVTTNTCSAATTVKVNNYSLFHISVFFLYSVHTLLLREKKTFSQAVQVLTEVKDALRITADFFL